LRLLLRCQTIDAQPNLVLIHSESWLCVHNGAVNIMCISVFVHVRRHEAAIARQAVIDGHKTLLLRYGRPPAILTENVPRETGPRRQIARRRAPPNLEVPKLRIAAPKGTRTRSTMTPAPPVPAPMPS